MPTGSIGLACPEETDGPPRLEKEGVRLRGYGRMDVREHVAHAESGPGHGRRPIVRHRVGWGEPQRAVCTLQSPGLVAPPNLRESKVEVRVSAPRVELQRVS